MRICFMYPVRRIYALCSFSDHGFEAREYFSLFESVVQTEIRPLGALRISFKYDRCGCAIGVVQFCTGCFDHPSELRYPKLSVVSSSPFT